MPRFLLSLRPAVALIVLLACAPRRGEATTVIAPDFESLVQQSGYVVRAVVVSTTPEWRPHPQRPGHRYIATRVELDVREAIKGTPPRRLLLDVLGGRIGDKELSIAGTPRFEVGTENIFFLHARGDMISPVVALKHGHYPVRRDARTGRDVVLRASGRALYSERDVALPLAAASAELARNPSAQPLTPAQFGARIREVTNRPARESLH